MQYYKYPGKETWKEIAQRPVADAGLLEKDVRKILEKVKEKGDRALRKFTRQFDGIILKKTGVTEKEIAQAADALPEALKTAILQARLHIETFHAAQAEGIKKIETLPGVMCWRKALPIERVGLYIPGGTAPLFSTVLMLGVPASLAGCREVVLCTPPASDGQIHPAILFAASLCGIHRIFKVGGAQAIAAMAYGTETIPKVNKIFGPGNQFVTLAKQMVQQQGVAIDMPAGPSEVLVIADATAVPAFVAADLLSQAEHGADSQVMLVTTDEKLADQVNMEIEKQVKALPRKELARLALANSKLLLVNTPGEAIEFSNYYAPEHLILCCENAETLADQVFSAGSVFIGNYSPESAGDYASGTNHTLPTNGYAAAYSGVSLDSFVKKISFQQVSEEGLRQLGNTIMEMAGAEGLEAHKNAVAIRLKK